MKRAHGASILQPDVISRIGNLELRAKLVVEGFIAGLHRSPYHGFSVEFAEHRQYMPGDDIRHIDWKVFGRTDRYFIKQYEEETNLKSYLIVDASRSMAFRTGTNPTKFEYAASIAAALAYLMVRQRDAVGLGIFDESVRSFLPPRSKPSYLQLLFKTLAETEPGRKTGTGESLHRIAERIKRRGLVVIFSDLFDDQDDVLAALKHFRYNRNEVIVMQVLDPSERSFAFGRDAVFRDMETNEKMTTQPYHIQHAYRSEMRKFLERYKRECREQAVDYVLLDTATPFDTALFQYLSKRKRLG
jgi:uncharacterized protein (DUF58 family)